MNKYGDQNLASAIRTLYEVFGVYRMLSSEFGACRWLTEAQISVLKRKPSVDLSVDELKGYAEHSSYCGNVNDLKHFLPRLVELFSHYSLVIPPEIFLNTLPYSTFSSAETAAIDFVLESMWKGLINIFPTEFHPDEFLCGLAQIYSDLTPFLEAWEKTNSAEALRQLAVFSKEATYCDSWT